MMDDGLMAMGARTRWRAVFAFPPCTHQTLTDRFTRHYKELDGRTFWGIALFIYVLCADSESVLVEQPDTIIPDYYRRPSQRLLRRARLLGILIPSPSTFTVEDGSLSLCLRRAIHLPSEGTNGYVTLKMRRSETAGVRLGSVFHALPLLWRLPI